MTVKLSLLKRIDFFYRYATLKLAQVIDKTTANPMSIDDYGDRVVASNKSEFDLAPKRVAQSVATQKNKPHGVWYAFGTRWITMMEIQGEHAYRIKVDESKLLKLNPSNIEKFINQYTTSIEGEDVARGMGIDVDNLPEDKRRALPYIFKGKPAIDWPLVASKYAGVEITDMQGISIDLRHTWDFLGAWDIDSGCIFDTSVIKEAKKLGVIPKFPEGDSYDSGYFGGYWGDSSQGLAATFEGKNGLVLGSSLSDYDIQFLSARLIQYNVHLTPEQIKETEFIVSPDSLVLKNVPAAPSHNGKTIPIESQPKPPQDI